MMHSKARRRGTKGRRGNAAIEFALVLLPLTYLLFGIVDYGWLFLQASLVSTAAREGSRAAAIGTDTDGESAVGDFLTNAGLGDTPDIVIDRSVEPYVQVIVSYPCTPLIGLAPHPTNLVSQVTMRVEN